MKNKLVSFALLLGLVVAGVSCKKENPQPAAEFTMSPTTLALSVNGVGTITTANASGEITWSIPNDGIVEFTLNADKTGGNVKAIKVGTTAIKATNSGKELTCTITVSDTPTPPTPTDLPSVQGTAGKYTLAFQAPASECGYDKGIFFYGAFEGNDPSNPDAPQAEAIVQEGFTNWFKVVFEAEDGTAMGKICPAQIDGSRSWNTQAKTFEVVQGDATSEGDMGANKIVFAASALGDVVYVTVAEWSADPCSAPNPEGNATFSVVLTTEFPDGFDVDDIEMAVSFWDQPGGTGTHYAVLTRDLQFVGGYKFTGVAEDYPANQNYKYIISYKEGEWIYEKGDDRSMPYSLTTNDEVSTWDSEPWNPIPGGNGTFKITLGAACGAADADKVIFTGNFTEEGWGDSQREMTPDNQGGWSWTGDFPENFMYKVILRTEGQDDKWVGPDGNWKFDGTTFEQEWSCE